MTKKLIIDVEVDKNPQNYDTICYFEGKWIAVSRGVYMTEESKKRCLLNAKVEELEKQLKEANEKIKTLAKIIKGE